MSITKTKSTHEKAIILLFSNNPHDTVRQDKLNDCCANNNLEIIKIIQTNCNYDPNIFYELIEIINKCDQPITIVIGEYSYATYTQIMSCCVLATLAMTGLVNICTYWQETGSNDLRLHFVKDHFPFFLAAEEFLKQLLSIADRKLVKDTPYKNGGGQRL